MPLGPLFSALQLIDLFIILSQDIVLAGFELSRKPVWN